MYDNTGEMVVQKKKKKLLVQACAHKTKRLGVQMFWKSECLRNHLRHYMGQSAKFMQVH